MTSSTAHSLRVAVIGGGAAGLSAARVLSRNGLTPLVLEKEEAIGGVWNYKADTTKTKPMYKGLRTNLPREIMAYREKPWGSTGTGKSYVTHKEVLEYLSGYKKDFELEKYINYGATVTQLKVLKDEPSNAQLGDETLPLFQLEWTTTTDNQNTNHCQTFDAVCVANGHYAKPAFAPVEGIEQFKGTIIHSMEYDDPSLYTDQTVLCIGGRASGSDLAREMSEYAKQVYLSDTTCQSMEEGGKVTWVPTTERVHPDGSIEFQNTRERVKVDTIVFCTGYDYEFPFITDASNLELTFLPGERRVTPLYKQLWHAQYPSLAFLGLPHSVLPFPLFELQMEAFVHQLLKKNNLPSLEERQQAAQQDAASGGAKPNGRIQDTHFLGGAQWEYKKELAAFADNLTPTMINYLATNKAIYDHAGSERKALFPGGPDTYRSTCYQRDNAKQSFTIVSTEMKEESSVTK